MARATTTTFAAALASALALAGCGGSTETAEPAAPPPPATTEPPATADTGPATTEAETTETEPETTESEPATTAGEPDEDVHVVILAGERVSGEDRVEAKQGDHVRIEVAVDAPQELHLHGYDLEQEASPEKPAVFDFTADLEGIFELESHLNEAVILELVVEP
jgi:hypothetical protein